MKLFECQSCGQVLYFENTQCERCGHRLGYLPGPAELSAVEEQPDGTWKALAEKKGSYRFCDNADQGACNWLVPADGPDTLCLCCRHNRTIPDITQPANLALWQRLEIAKHRMFYSLIQLGLPLPTRAEHAEGLVFDVLADDQNAPPVLTGHDYGLITLNLAEADDAEREKRRSAMGEPYRTLLGHFRHEIAHFLWDRLVRDDPATLARCREVFGDESADYAAALQAHYAKGAPPDWQARHVSAYASAHPWEDFAETCAHYLHIVDTLETAAAFGLRIRPKVAASEELAADLRLDPYKARDIETLAASWLPLAFAVNSLNRSMGQPDLYPFVLSEPAIAKLGFIHALVHAKR